MSNKQETIAGIVAEMRLGVKDWKGERLGVFDCFADRIKAAHRREVAELERKMNDVVCENEALRDACGTCGAKREREETREQSAQVGNSAKMREALSRILGIADHLQTRFAIPKFASEEILELKQMAESALAEPPRNCDALSKAEVLEMLKDRSFSKEDTIEWLYEEAK